MRAVLLIVVVAACWREAPPPEQPYVSFVARVHAMNALRHDSAALAGRIATIRQRMNGLASEAERDALRGDLIALEQDLVRLLDMADAARKRGEDPALLADIDGRLADATIATVTLRGELRHARTTAEQEAFEALKKKVEGSHDPSAAPIRIYRRDPLLVPGKPDPIRLP